MVLKLFWKDNNENTYILGKLYKSEQEYCFDIEEEQLKQAINHGCFGIGELNLLYNKHVSDTLFEFFKRRIPAKENPNIEEIMKQLNIKEYDEMELLEKTNGVLDTDRYYLEKEEIIQY